MHMWESGNLFLLVISFEKISLNHVNRLSEDQLKQRCMFAEQCGGAEAVHVLLTSYLPEQSRLSPHKQQMVC